MTLAELVKALGFVLHAAPMHLALGGALVAGALVLSRLAEHRRLAGRLATGVPLAAALAAATGMVPLLWYQTAWSSAFFPATDRLGWAWFAVIPAILLAFAAMLELAQRVAEGRAGPVGVAAGVAGAIALFAAGWIFTGAVPADAEPAGARGLRWLLTLTFALSSTGLWIQWEAGRRQPGDPAGWERWARHFGSRLHGLALLAFVLTGYLFLRDALPVGAGDRMGEQVPFALAALAVLLPAAAWGIARQAGAATGLALVLQFAGLAATAAVREMVQRLAASEPPAPIALDTAATLGITEGLIVVGAVWLLVRGFAPAPKTA